jgi:hypothetical protein
MLKGKDEQSKSLVALCDSVGIALISVARKKFWQRCEQAISKLARLTENR